MIRGILSILIGGAMVVGGLSGKIALKGTDSTMGAVVLGGIVVLIGVARIAAASSASKQSSEQPPEPPRK